MKMRFNAFHVPALAAIAALGAIACGPACSDAPYCRDFSVPTWCQQQGQCALSKGIRTIAGDVANDSSFGDGTFADMWPNSDIRVPLDALAAQIQLKPVLVLWLSAGAPLAASAVLVELDGKPVTPNPSATPDADSLRFTINMPTGAHELHFAYVAAGLSVGHGWAAFDLDMHLEEESAACSGTMRVCAE